MKIRVSSWLRDARGSTYITVLWLAILAGTVLAAYLTMVSSQNSYSMRSQSWNRSIAVAEAGVEEALSYINKYGMTNYNYYLDGWWFMDGQYHKRRSLDDSMYEVMISPGLSPSILSRGYVPFTQNYASRGAFGPFLADAVAWWWGTPDGNFIYRTVRVDTTTDGTFTKGMVAKDYIDMKGNGVRTDSFDSTDPKASTNGMYYQPWARANGDVATASGLTNFNNISVGNANIYGHVATGPKGVVTLGPNGGVGDFNWQPGNPGTIEPGWFRDDLNLQFPPVAQPFSSGYFTPSSGTVGGTNYSLVLGTGKYYSGGSMKLSGQNSILINGAAVWWCAQGLDFSGQGSMIIAPGASLTLYVGKSTGNGASLSIAGNGIINGTGNATNCMMWGLPSCTSVSYNGNAAYVGTIYAPNADFSLGGGGNDVNDFIGASVTLTVTLNGHFNFHYDEALGRLGPKRGYIITAWNEVANK
jgi:hypothetical protein